MRKWIVAAMISVCITLAGMAVNYVSFQKAEHLKLAIRNHGGEITIEYGFGLRAVHLYGMAMGDVTTHTLRFDPASLLLTFLLVGVFVFIVLYFAEKIRSK